MPAAGRRAARQADRRPRLQCGEALPAGVGGDEIAGLAGKGRVDCAGNAQGREAVAEVAGLAGIVGHELLGDRKAVAAKQRPPVMSEARPRYQSAAEGRLMTGQGRPASQARVAANISACM